jgi:hypothetical protein
MDMQDVLRNRTFGLVFRISFLLAFAATGCAHFYKLDPKNVTALEVGGGGQLCARGALVDVLALTKDGQKHPEGEREHPKENEFDPALVKLEASVGAFHDRSWNPPDDPLALLPVDGVTITATLVANPSITATTKLAPTWACDAPAAYVGGNDGGQGEGGVQDGEAGQPGQPGESAREVVVTIGWIQHGDGRLAIADVQTENGTSTYVLDPSTPLSVFARGGAGGAGGMGSFGRGMDNCEGRGGPGGRGGDGGDGGDGGNVIVRYDAQSPELERMVNVDASGGDAGPPGSGGSGGSGPNGCGEWGKSGDDGREGRGGRNGRVSPQPQRGINDRLASLSSGSPRPTPAPMPSRPGAGPRSAPVRDTADGARYYAGRAELTAMLKNRRPEHQRMSIRVESTRTRRRHFTIVFGQCKLDFHRPPNEQRHIYVLDAPTKCQDGTGFVDIRDAKLELDTASDGLSLTWHGTGEIKGQGTMTVDFAFAGKRG